MGDICPGFETDTDEILDLAIGTMQLAFILNVPEDQVGAVATRIITAMPAE